MIWLAYELIVLIGPGAFRDAQYYVLGALGLGLVFYVVQLVTEPEAMRVGAGIEPSEHPRHRPGDVGDEGAAGRPGRRDARPGGGPGPATRSVGPDGVEADPEELFGSVVEAGTAGAGRRPARRGGAAHAVALANQGETVLAWDRRSGRPLSRAIVWQDRRSAGVCARLADRAGELAALTGLPLDPYFAAPKMTWLRENVTADGVVTTTDTWLLHRLGAGYVTDAATASRTMLLDLDAPPGPRRPARRSGSIPRRCRAVADCAGVVGETGCSAARCRSPGSPWTSRPRCCARGLPGRGRRQVHLRDRRVPAGHDRCPGGQVRRGAVLLGGLAAGRRR